jgi:D-alanyl-D-alanine carboxypeptidase
MYRKIVIGITSLALVAVIFPKKVWQSDAGLGQVSSASIDTATSKNQLSAPQEIPGQPSPVIFAKAVLAVDLNSQSVLYQVNPDKKLPIASLTKLMTAMVILDHVNKDQVVTIDKSVVTTPCACMGLLEGEKITVENLLKGMLIPSDNDAAIALSYFVGGSEENFVGMMNDKTTQLKLNNTHFSNPAGLESFNNYSTAGDLSKITQEFMKYALLSRIVATKSEDVASVDGKISHHLLSSNKLLLQNPDVIGVKTGFTVDAQGNMITEIKHEDSVILTIVLNTDSREDDSNALIDWVFKTYKW